MIIPFFIPHAGCPHQCVFCDQRNITGRKIADEPSSLHRTVNRYLESRTSEEPCQIAFYGGTFTALPPATQKAYLEAAQPFIASGRVRSIRLSTRPDCISREVLGLLKEHHVETIELGVQSLDDTVLILSGRGHTAADTVHATRLLREYGFRVGLQLMPGLPGDSAETFQETVAGTISLAPDFVRLYPALVIRDTPLEELYRTNRYAPLALDEAIAVCKHALLRLAAEGIDVVRIGLQPTEELEKAGTVIAGPFHPAFRQLVESAILLDSMRTALEHGKVPPTAVFLVHPLDISNAAGQHRSNIAALKTQFGLKHVRIRPESGMPRRTVVLAHV